MYGQKYAWIRFCVRTAFCCHAIAGCPDGWISYKHSCYWFSTDSQTGDYANNYCQGLEGYLVQLESVDEILNMYTLLDSRSYKTYLIGLTDKESEGQFVWMTTNVPPVYIPWATTSTGIDTKDCVTFASNGYDVTEVPCTDPFRYRYICEKNDCPQGWKSYGHACFFLSSEELNWDQAVEQCEGNDSYLAEIGYYNENAFLSSLVGATDYSDYYIGLSYQEEGGYFEWKTSGNILEYSAWSPGQPNQSSNGTCVYYHDDGKWNVANCTTKYRFICQKSNCPAGWREYESKCYYFSNDSRNWNQAFEQCKALQSYLVEIDSNSIYGFLYRVFMLTGFSNYYIGLSDQDDEGTFVWMTSKNSLWASAWDGGRPEDNDAKDCVGYVNALKWAVYDCTRSSRYICEKPIYCFPDTCPDGFICEDLPQNSGYRCVCPDGYEGANCDEDIDECVNETHNCLDNEYCTNTQGSFTCTRNPADEASNTSVICNPDNTISVFNLPSDYHYFAMQNVNVGPDKKCTVTNLSSTTVTITECSKDLPILLTYGTYSGMATNDIHGGKSMSTMIIKCREVPQAGKVHAVNSSFAASLVLDAETSINPTYEVDSSLNVTSSTVGNPVSWTISFPPEYTLEVSSCSANPGNEKNSTNSVSLITNGGCSASSELISHFTDNSDGTATATILAFKFVTDDNVFLTCDLKICPNGSSSCDTTCSRVTRSVEQIRATRETREDKEVYSATVNNHLYVIDHSSNVASLVCKSNSSVILTLTFMILYLRNTVRINWR